MAKPITRSRKNAVKSGITAVVLLALQPSAFTAEQTNSDFKYTAEDIHNHLVVITTVKNNVSSEHCGFIATMDGHPYLLTSQHLILGAEKIRFSSATGRSIRPRSIELSAGRNIARMALSEGEGLALSSNPAMGESIGVFSSTEDTCYGAVSGLGAEIVEVSADITDDHSGSAILNADRQILGMASYVRESHNHAMKKGTRFENNTRRFCTRIDRVNWKKVNWKQFNKQFGSVYEDGRSLTDEVIKILNSWAEGPFDPLKMKDTPEQRVSDWAALHNRVVSQYVKGANYNRKFSAEYKKSTSQLADLCRSRAKKIRMVSEQRGLTPFLLKEYDMQAGTLEYAAKIIDQYGAVAY